MLRIRLFLGAVLLVATFLISGSAPSLAATDAPKVFEFVASLCGSSSSAARRLTNSMGACTAPTYAVRLSLVENAELVVPRKRQMAEQAKSCVFVLQRTQSLAPGLSSDADYFGVASRLVFRDLPSKPGQVLLLTINVLKPDPAGAPKGSASLGQLKRLLRDFDSGAVAFFPAEDYLRPVDCST